MTGPCRWALPRQVGRAAEEVLIPSPTTSAEAYLMIYDHDITAELDPAAG